MNYIRNNSELSSNWEGFEVQISKMMNNLHKGRPTCGEILLTIEDWTLSSQGLTKSKDYQQYIKNDPANDKFLIKYLNAKINR